MTLIENLLDIMKKKGISAYKLEKEIGIKQSTFGSWKTGSQPTADKLLLIMQYIGVTPNELFGYESIINLSDNDKEMLNLFHKLSEREQIKFIARLEDVVQEQPLGESSNSKIG